MSPIGMAFGTTRTVSDLIQALFDYKCGRCCKLKKSGRYEHFERMQEFNKKISFFWLEYFSFSCPYEYFHFFKLMLGFKNNFTICLNLGLSAWPYKICASKEPVRMLPHMTVSCNFYCQFYSCYLMGILFSLFVVCF